MERRNVDKIKIMKIINLHFFFLLSLLSNLENYFASDIREQDPGGEFQECGLTSLCKTSVWNIEADSSPQKGKSKERPNTLIIKLMEFLFSIPLTPEEGDFK